MSANPFDWIAGLWALAVSALGEWAYVGAAFGLSGLIILALTAWRLAAYWRAIKADGS